MMSKKVAMAGMFTALAMIFSYVEVLIPINLGIPGMKLGLANLVVVTALYTMGAPMAFAVSMIRIMLVSVTFGSLGCHALQSGRGHIELLRHDAAEKNTEFLYDWSECGRRYSSQYRSAGCGHGGGGEYSSDFLSASPAHCRNGHRNVDRHCVRSGCPEDQICVKIKKAFTLCQNMV